MTARPDVPGNVVSLATQPGPTTALVQPAGTVADIEQAFRDYQLLCGRILSDDDYQAIGGKRFRKRSAWRKLAVAFGVSFHIIERDIRRDDDGRVTDAEFTVRAVAPNGRYADGWGACDVFERCCPPNCNKGGKHRHCPSATGEDCPGWTHFSHANHDVPATSETRAKNRAASDLFGMGEVSAEEITEAEAQHEHERSMDELGVLLDTAEAAGLTIDREKAVAFASQSPAAAQAAVHRLHERLADHAGHPANVDDPVPDDTPESSNEPADDADDVDYSDPEAVHAAIASALASLGRINMEAMTQVAEAGQERFSLSGPYWSQLEEDDARRMLAMIANARDEVEATDGE